MDSDLKKYQEIINRIYSDANKRRARNKKIPFKILEQIKNGNKQIVEEYFTASFLQKRLFESVENILRRVTRKMITKEDFVSFWGWLFSFANIYDIDVFETIVQKFPLVCYYCLSAPCVCILYGKRANPKKTNYSTFSIEDKENERRKIHSSQFLNSYKQNKKIYDFKYLSGLIDTIYPNNRTAFTYFQHYEHSLKINEELNELVRASDAYMESSGEVEKNIRFDEFKKEFADLSLWIISLWDNIFPNLDLDIEFRNYFRNGCSVCKSTPCKCANIIDRSRYNIKAAGFLIELAGSIKFFNDEEVKQVITQLKNAIEALDEIEISHYSFELEHLIRRSQEEIDLAQMRS